MNLLYVIVIALSVMASLCLLSFCIGFVSGRRLKLHSKRGKKCIRIFGVLWLITAILALVFDVILPIAGVSEYMVVGLIAVEVMIIVYYGVLLYNRVIVISNAFQKIISYFVIMSSVAILYISVFAGVFRLVFGENKVSDDMFILNFLIVMVVLLAFPMAWNLNIFMRSILSASEVDLTFVVKKMSEYVTSNVDPAELAAFVADYMHFSYIGIFINGKLYGSSPKELSSKELLSISTLKPANGITWQRIEGGAIEVCQNHHIVAVAELKNAKGRPYGQLLLGKPVGQKSFGRKDLAQIEFMVNLVSAVIDSENKPVKKTKGWKK